MTTTQLDHLRRIDAHLERLLDIAKKRTPGRWRRWRNSEEDSQHVRTGDNDHAIADCWQQSLERNENNTAFIASCASNAEAGWESTRETIASVEAFLKVASDEPDGPIKSMAALAAKQFSKHLLAQWPEELLATAKV